MNLRLSKFNAFFMLFISFFYTIEKASMQQYLNISVRVSNGSTPNVLSLSDQRSECTKYLGTLLI